MSEFAARAKSAWARLIRKVYESDPLDRVRAFARFLYRNGKDPRVWSLWAHDGEFGPKSLHDMRSVSKSVTGLLFGIALKDLARDALFGPLGITDCEWVSDLHSRPMAFAGLRLRPRDLAKIGQMLLDHGQWKGRQVVPADWVASSLQAHVGVADELGYGYQFWTGALKVDEKKYAWSGCMGLGGQRLYMVPELDLAVVVTAGLFEDAQPGRTVFPILRKIVAALR